MLGARYKSINFPAEKRGARYKWERDGTRAIVASLARVFPLDRTDLARFRAKVFALVDLKDVLRSIKIKERNP